MTINTVRLVLRPFQPGDLSTMHAYASDPENTEYMLYLPNRSIEGTERFLRMAIAEWEKDKPQFYEFAIVLDGKHIGAVSAALDESGQESELGWILHKDYWGKGYASEAAKAIMDFAFEELKVKKVVAHCDYRNVASIRIIEKIGMTLERDDLTRRNKSDDEDVQELMYSAYR